MAKKPTDHVQFKIRIRRSLLLKIQREAEKKKHSANTEAVARLEESFARDEQARRDTAILNMIVDPDRMSSAFLRQIASELMKSSKSINSEADFKAFLTGIRFSAYGKEIEERIKSGEIPDDQPEGDDR